MTFRSSKANFLHFLLRPFSSVSPMSLRVTTSFMLDRALLPMQPCGAGSDMRKMRNDSIGCGAYMDYRRAVNCVKNGLYDLHFVHPLGSPWLSTWLPTWSSRSKSCLQKSIPELHVARFDIRSNFPTNTTPSPHILHGAGRRREAQRHPIE